MNIKLPKYLRNLDRNEQEDWVKIKEISNELKNHYRITNARNPLLSNFHLFAGKQKPTFFNSYTIHSDSNAFTLCIIEYQTTYQEVSNHGGRTHTANHKYFFGHIGAKKDFAHTLIRPETLADKITELFVPVEIDIKGYRKFSNKYYVLSNDKEKFLGALSKDLLDFLAQQNHLEIEFNGQACLFKLDKAIELKQTLKLCEIGMHLDEILN